MLHYLSELACWISHFANGTRTESFFIFVSVFTKFYSSSLIKSLGLNSKKNVLVFESVADIYSLSA